MRSLNFWISWRERKHFLARAILKKAKSGQDTLIKYRYKFINGKGRINVRADTNKAKNESFTVGNKTMSCFLLKRNPSSNTRKSTLVAELKQTFLYFTQINLLLATWGVCTLTAKEAALCCSKISLVSRIFSKHPDQKRTVWPTHKKAVSSGRFLFLQKKVLKKINELQSFRFSPVMRDYEANDCFWKRRFCEEKPRDIFGLFFG